MDERDSSTVFLDVILLALAGFVCLVILLLPHINKPTPQTSGKDANESVIVEITWQHRLDADIDLWVKAPGDVAVGYSNKGGIVCNLLRDDLGQLADPLEINHEETVCRGIVPNQRYTVNAHAFRATEGVPWPIKVNMTISTKKGIVPLHTIITGVGKLNRWAEEITLANFMLDEHGALVPGSLDTVQVPLRSFSAK